LFAKALAEKHLAATKPSRKLN